MDANTPPTTPTRFARVRWPLIIIAMLSGHVTAMMLAVNIARGNSAETGNGHSVLPSYYERAVNWDEDRAAIARSAELGWQAAVTPAIFTDGSGNRSVTVQMTDRSGKPLTGLVVSAKAWHHAIGDIVTGDCQGVPGADGIYQVNLPMGRAGQWDFEIAATRSSDSFVAKSTVKIASLAPAASKEQR